MDVIQKEGGVMISVLIVDDERLVRKTLLKIIDWEALGVGAVYEAEDGLRGLAAVEQYAPSIIISDVKMPHMNGLDFVRKVRERDAPCHIVFSSGYTDKQYLMGAIDLHVDGYIEKPLNPQEIAKLIRKLVLVCQKEAAESEPAFFFHGANGIPILNNKIFTLKRPTLVSFGEYLRHKNAPKARALLFSVCAQMRQSEGTKPDYIRNVFSRLALQIESAAELQGALAAQNACDQFAYAAASFQCLDELEEKLYALTDLYFSSVLERSFDPVNLVNDYLREHFSESDLTVKSISQQLNFSTSHLCTVYKKKTGRTINAALTAIRIDAARQLLRCSDSKLYAIGKQVGYPDGKYFTKIFTKETGITPRQYREQHHENQHI